MQIYAGWNFFVNPMTTGAKKISDNNPTEIPFCATISATSPRLEDYTAAKLIEAI